MSTDVHHPLFARFFDRFSEPLEREIGPRRTELLTGLNGRVLEVGCGNGMNFSHYPDTVSEVVAIEPEPYLRGKALAAAVNAPVPVTISDAVADPLPFDDRSFDAAVVSLVLCSVPDQARALAEIKRVLKPGGELRFLEHVASEEPRKRRIQDWLDDSGIWPRIGGGCHCARDTSASIEQAGFDVEHARRLAVGPSFMHTNPHVIGAARKPGAGAAESA